MKPFDCACFAQGCAPWRVRAVGAATVRLLPELWRQRDVQALEPVQDLVIPARSHDRVSRNDRPRRLRLLR